jgi:hypothetical protein
MGEGAHDVSGRCLCGAVRYKARASNSDVSACHCGMCRRWTGGPLLYIHIEGKPAFTGEDAIGLFRSSEIGERGFCKKCGSILFWKTADQDSYTIAAGSIDDQAGLVFTREIFIDDKPPYYDFANATQRLTGAESAATYLNTSDKTE